MLELLKNGCIKEDEPMGEADLVLDFTCSLRAPSARVRRSEMWAGAWGNLEACGLGCAVGESVLAADFR